MKKITQLTVLAVLVCGRPQAELLGFSESNKVIFPKFDNPTSNYHQILHNLNGLLSIKSWSQYPRQPYEDFDILHSKAHQAQCELEGICKKVALMTNGESQFSGTKNPSRSRTKIEQELNGKTEHLTDIARASIITDSISELITAYEQLSRESTLVSVKNRFSQPAKSGYRDIQLLVRLPKTHIISEVQLHLRKIAEIKNGAEHDIYEEVQQIERLAGNEERSLNNMEIARIEQLRAFSQSLYANAWNDYLSGRQAIA